MKREATVDCWICSEKTVQRVVPIESVLILQLVILGISEVPILAHFLLFLPTFCRILDRVTIFWFINPSLQIVYWNLEVFYHLIWYELYFKMLLPVIWIRLFSLLYCLVSWCFLPACLLLMIGITGFVGYRLIIHLLEWA